MSLDAPFVRFGLTSAASLAELRVARRRLAFALHPDRGGSDEQMKQLNRDFDLAVKAILGRTEMQVRRRADPAPTRNYRSSVQHDMPSFVINMLPAEAFEHLLVVTSWIGEVLVDDPPYLLEVHLHEPGPCWCRLTLVPDAGASTVSLTIAAYGETPPPDIDDVRDTWVKQLNQA
jgi:hypothetical protein